MKKTDADGCVILDTKADRIAKERAELDLLTDKSARSAPLRAMLASYSAATSDSANELMHLYEIRDALHAEYGSDDAAKKALGISSGEWSRFGGLANGPIEQGRHRGKFPEGLRDATPEELADSRQLAYRWILVFAATVN
jgi:hypothetical protein